MKDLKLQLVIAKDGISQWIDTLSESLEPGRFRFCNDGSLVPVSGHYGLMPTCFAVRTAWQTKIWDSWSTDKRNSCISFIKSFQRNNGLFYDPWLVNNSKKNNIKQAVKAFFSTKDSTLTLNLRAETRQCTGDLTNVGEKPDFALPLLVKTTSDLHRYLDKLDWSNPWAAGSHLGHLIAFISINYYEYGLTQNYNEYLEIIDEHLNSLYEPETGTWFKGQPSNQLKINGAMKVLAGKRWSRRDYQNTKPLMDFVLNQPFQLDGCSLLNSLFAMQQSRFGCPNSYRAVEIDEKARQALDIILQLQNIDGGFSFYPGKSQTYYYGIDVSNGLAVSDLHGAAMLTWAIAVALDLLIDKGNLSEKDKWFYHSA